MKPGHALLCAAAVLFAFAVVGGQPASLAQTSPRPPKPDLFEHFDNEQSPLQKGLLDARDSKWAKNMKLSDDPQCRRVVREFAQDKRTVKLCDDYGFERARCLQEYCCTELTALPDGGVECTGPEDAVILACANAVIDGGDTSVCYPPPTPAPATAALAARTLAPDASANTGDAPSQAPSAPTGPAPGMFDAKHKACVDEIFVRGHSNKVAECLEDPDRDGDGEIDNKCRSVFEVCEDVPVAKAVKTYSSSDSKSKRVHSRTTIQYDRPRRWQNPATPDDEAWDVIKIRGARTADETQGVPSDDNRPVDTQLGASTYNPAGGAGCDPLHRCAENDDGDCYDRVTGEHRTDCFDATGRLLPTLEPVGDGCRHVETGDMFRGDAECTADDGGLATTLVQLVDEDSSAVVNNDADCKLEGTAHDGLRSDCLGADARLRDGYVWNVNEEQCDGDNDDGDCLVVESELVDPTLCEPCPDPANCPNECYRGKGWIGLLDAGQCVLADGRRFDAANFKELIDEDCAESVDEDRDGREGFTSLAYDCEDGLDNDGDGMTDAADAGCSSAIDEDPPGVRGAPLPFALVQGDDPTIVEDRARCQAFYRQVGLEADGSELPNEAQGCDMDRAMRVHVNRELARDPDTHENFRRRAHREKIFDVDDAGRWCDDSTPTPGCESNRRGVVNKHNDHDPHGGRYKFEERQVTVDEVFAVKCKPVRIDADGDGRKDDWAETLYDEATGECVASTQPLSFAPAVAFADDGRCAASNPPAECRQAMMGFTFAPPVLEWGWRVQWRVCIFGFCFEIFYARIGYEFDLAAGVRLPIEIDFDNLPTSVLATDQNAFDAVRTTVEPKDFSVDEFKTFCELHDLDEPWYISDCDRFSFPDFMDARDGDEFVAHYTIFAGLVVRVFYVPLINWAIDSSVDVPAMCTIFKLKDGVQGLSYEDGLKIALGLFETSGDVLKVLKDNLGNCGSFKTPFGMEECPPWECSTGWKLRGWPFLSLEKHIRADCVDAVKEKEVVTIKGKTYPICTHLVLGTHGASLGVGLTLKATAGSRLVTSDWTASGDAGGSGELNYTKSKGEPDAAIAFGAITPDNYVDRLNGGYQDNAVIALDDFTYYLNAIEIALSASLEFGGILSPIPNIASFTLYNYVFDTGRYGIPIPRHAYTEPVKVSIPVENYGLVIDVQAPAADPDRVDDKTLVVKPGTFGDFDIAVTNIGSFPGGFDNFAVEFSNQADPSGVFTFVVDPNTDHDCMDLARTTHFRGYPHDGVADDCYDASGVPRADRVELIDEDPRGPAGQPRTVRDEDADGLADEDPPDVWRFAPDTFPATVLTGVPAHTGAPPVVLSVSPFAHALTRPGLYAFRVTADSVEARQRQMPATDPLGFHRLESISLRGQPEAYTGPAANPHVGFMQVNAFFDPQVVVIPPAATLLPGGSQEYIVEGTNGANVEDALLITTVYEDSNAAGCDIAARGRLPAGSDPDCPYRAEPTAIPASWLVGAPPDHFGTEESLLEPLDGGAGSFQISTPSNWAGIDDTVYTFTATATSVMDETVPPAHNSATVEHRVTATLESRTRYIGLEIDALIAEIERANREGVKTGGLHPISTHPMRQTNQQALDRVLSGNPRGAIQSHQSNIQKTNAFLKNLAAQGRKIPAAYAADWKRRADAIIADLNTTIARGY